MRAVVCKQFAEPSALVFEERPAPPLGVGQVRIGVYACGVNYPDALIVQGLYQVRPELPFTPGLEVAGEVLEVGQGVSHVQAGDRVIALMTYGGYADEVVVPAEMVVTIPDTMPYEIAAAFSVAYGTSHVALAHRGELRSGETLLVLGAAGGVGLTAVEIGKLMGAKVIAAASTAEKLALCQQYGADYLINYKEEDLREKVREYTGRRGANVVLDPVGGDYTEVALRSIAWEGRLLVIGFASGKIPSIPANLPLLKNCSLVGVYWGEYARRNPRVLVESLALLLEQYANDRLKPHISQTYPLENAADALTAILTRQAKGKLVLTTGR